MSENRLKNYFAEQSVIRRQFVPTSDADHKMVVDDLLKVFYPAVKGKMKPGSPEPLLLRKAAGVIIIMVTFASELCVAENINFWDCLESMFLWTIAGIKLERISINV